MAQTIVLIDYENVGSPGLEGLPEQCRVILFIGRTQPLPKNDQIEKLLNDGKRVEIIKIAGVGKDNLDHHLALYLGKTIGREPQANYIIISNDRSGFDPLAEHVTKVLGTSCRRQLPNRRPAKPVAKQVAAPATAKPAVKATPPKAPAAKPAAKQAKAAAPGAAKTGKSVTTANALAFLQLNPRPPKTRDALMHYLGNHYGIAENETAKLVDGMAAEKHFRVAGNGKITY